MSRRTYRVTVETLPKDSPKDFEMSAALIVAQHFKTDVVFLRPGFASSADLDVNGVIWEIKSPAGSGKNTVANNLKTARKQSKNIIIDTRRTKLRFDKIISRLTYHVRRYNMHFEKVLLISKTGKVIDISDRL